MNISLYTNGYAITTEKLVNVKIQNALKKVSFMSGLRLRGKGMCGSEKIFFNFVFLATLFTINGVETKELLKKDVLLG